MRLSSAAIPFAVLHVDPMQHPKRTPIAIAARSLSACVLVPAVLLLLAACGAEAPDAPRGGERPPIDPEVVREEVEQHESFGELRQAACPRRIPDRIEKRRPFPAIDLLEGLEYVTISDDSSRGMYEKVIELTDLGRQELADDLEEEEDRYVITIAQREYIPGRERYENAPRRDDRIVVSFVWRWKGLNPLGERFSFWAPDSGRNEHQGRATYQRTGDGWELDDLWLAGDGRDYVSGIYR